jgi:5-methyltetrahydrofolate--homocysteine methyltransferase
MSFLNALHSRCLLADGAMGSELQKRGLPFATSADQWSVSHPQEVLAVHQAYVAAGCELILTNTLTANTTMYDEAQTIAINRAAVGLARQSGAKWVAGSMGPGADEPQARALAEAGVDAFWLETQLGISQVVDSIAACRRVSATLPILVSFSFHQPTPITHSGESALEIAEIMPAYGVSALGINCGHGFRHVESVLSQISATTSFPLILKPNAGIPYSDTDGVKYEGTAQEWVVKFSSLQVPELAIIGGCCGTTPAYLAALHQKFMT